MATGIAVALSRSTAQLADFIRRTVELMALLVSWLVFRRVERKKTLTPAEKARLEGIAGTSVAVALLCSGAVMLILALSRIAEYQPGGNVYPGLAVAVNPVHPVTRCIDILGSAAVAAYLLWSGAKAAGQR